jgi:hypothetical protein
MTINNLETLKVKIKTSYEEGVTLEQAEKLAGEFLHAQMDLANELKAADLDARMRKSGLKAIRAAVFLEAVSSSEKKPTDSTLTAIIDSHETVAAQQDLLDKAEVNRDHLQNFLDIFHEAHLHFRAISRGRFE